MSTTAEQVKTVRDLVVGAVSLCDRMTRSSDFAQKDLAIAAAMISGAEFIVQTMQRELSERQAKSAPQAGDWARALNSEHMHRGRGMVNAMTMEDIVAFEDAEKAAQAGGLVDTKA